MFGLVKKWLARRGEEPFFCSAVVPAAGASSRMGGQNKLFAPVDGVPVLVRSVLALSRASCIHEVVVAVRESDLLDAAELLRPYPLGKPLKLVVGGATRLESVMAALRECSGEATLVAVHDAARPLVPPEVVEEAVEKARTCYAAAPAVPVKDTIKVAENGVVRQTPDRATLYAVQTPQVFDRDLLASALQAALDQRLPVTDDCSAVERLGKAVYLTAGSYENIKITTPEDLLIAQAICEGREEAL